MEFIPFKRNHIEQVLSIANSTLGANYLTVPYLNKYLNSNNYLAFVIIEDNKVVGFISSVILTPPQLKETVLKEKDWFYELSKKYSKISLQKQVIVHPSCIGKGYGSQLVKLSSKVIDSLCDFQLSNVWIKRSNNAMSNLLLKNGFERSKNIPNYWQADSLDNKYSCPECGTPPCLCSTEVYCKKMHQR
tara:strand:- start:1650 stop:2216 length:567 start_codon:yes stop_codon:yes gene_type:complete